MRTQQTHFLEEHIRQLEQENERLFVENQCQRQEYERFLDQLTTMVIRTAVMQEVREQLRFIYNFCCVFPIIFDSRRVFFSRSC